MRWPGGKNFAFTIVDDTDGATVETVAPVYRLLHELGMRTTKTVWPLGARGPLGGQTLQDPEYRKWILQIANEGFEIGLHGSGDRSSLRSEVLAALDLFNAVLGQNPRIHTNHVGQKEALFWGAARLEGTTKLVYRATQKLIREESKYFGHVEGSKYFWGDLAQERIDYVRNFVFRDVNTLRQDLMMPYHDPRRPYVNHWFSSSEGADVESFCSLLSEAGQDRLIAEGGACIVYTHLASGFFQDGSLNPRFTQLMKRLANSGGWFVTGSELLDHLKLQDGRSGDADPKTLRRMQREWLTRKLIHGRS